MQPFLRWAGSKRRLLGTLKGYWSTKYVRYLEPFIGSGALFFTIEPPAGVLSDVNFELIQTFRAIARDPGEVYEACQGILPGKESYDALRDLSPADLPRVQRAARFLFLNRYCFNGLYRTNQNGKFNVPFAPAKTGGLPSLQQIKDASRLLRRATIRHGDFETVIRDEVRRGDFVYLDPPYAIANRRVFRQYDPTTFGLEDISRLGSLLHEIHRRKAAFVLSYAYSKEALSLAKEWKSVRVSVTRNISGFSNHRRRALELVITNIDTGRHA